jgi:tetratricopeptide (TPR) repeat protein
VHRALVNVFARGDNAFDTPLNVQLHRRLGDIYLFAKRPVEAEKQYTLALQLSPRDIFLLHKCGLALLERGDEPGAQVMLDRVLEVDVQAGRWSTEVAGMRGRLAWQRYQRTGLKADLAAARDAYGDGLAGNPTSHYMADNVGQMNLLLGETEAAHQAFMRALEALEFTGDTGYWARATHASCLLALGRRDEGLRQLARVHELRPEPAVLDSVRRGLTRLHRGLGLPETELNAWFTALAGA